METSTGTLVASGYHKGMGRGFVEDKKKEGSAGFLIFAGVIVVLILVMIFSGRGKKKKK